jgi:hypothetical protein
MDPEGRPLAQTEPFGDQGSSAAGRAGSDRHQQKQQQQEQEQQQGQPMQARQQQETVQAAHGAPQPPGTSAEFMRAWRGLAGWRGRLDYLRALGPQQLPGLFRVEITPQLLGEVVAALEEGRAAAAAAGEARERARRQPAMRARARAFWDSDGDERTHALACALTPGAQATAATRRSRLQPRRWRR